ncbi:GntR family transcriptional regulator [Paracoccus caeni]|uniref:GntR family transcriptional regulator n=1 Tax=Paracoccus caeni TaxID=657651 RepID=A0A934SH00_9RHOB|nr:GntR family transcriptional regulator [Paracoccus caeni]MBK4215227.1 GntR family transcriptional regulator [Paracoccus caeni]
MTELPPSLAEETAARIREEIAHGRLTAGQKLSEAKLSAELGISRNTLREAFRLMTRDGILEHEPNRGMYVATPSMASTLDIFRVRRLIEIPALAQAWPRHQAVARMREAVERAEALRAKDDWRGVGSANMDFHMGIVALTDSPRLISFFARIVVELRLAFGLLDSPEMLHRPYIERNRQILTTLEAGNPEEASQILAEYLDQSERAVMAAFARLG